MKSFLTLLLLIFLSTQYTYAQCYNLVWADEFDGSSVDLSKWSYQIGAGGWGNNELQYYSDRVDNSTVSNGALQIIAKSESYMNASYTSARMRTINQGDWTYGKMEASIKLPVGQGIWPAFWMMPTESTYGIWPRSGEIDIMEYLGHQTSINYGTCHFGNAWNDKGSSGNSRNIAPASYADGAFHTFTIEWEPSQIRWYVDGIQYHTFNAADVGGFPFPFDQDFHFILNIAVGGNWPGNPDGTTVFPQVMEVDYVRVYQELADIELAGEVFQVPNSTNTTYSVPNLPSTTYTWAVPAGASISSGAGTHQITVDWGAIGGDIEVAISNTCGSQTLTKSVSLSANLAANPGFEFDLDNWYTKAFNGAWANWTINTTDVHSGNKAMCAEVTSLSPNAWDVQISPETVNLVAGENYTISFWGKADATRTSSLAVINSTNYTYYTGASYSFTDTWTQYTHTFTAPAAAIGLINIEFGYELGTFCIDDFLFARTADLPIASIDLNLKVMLEGPYTDPMMHDTLRARSLLPSAEPFSALGFPSVNNLVNETIAAPATVLADYGNASIVDWIFVELRAANDPSVVVATRSALLQRDGDVVELDGVSPLAFAEVYAGDYHIAIRHRNHLGIRTLNTINISASSAITLDFSAAATLVAGTDARKDINGTMVLWTGDALVDNTIDALDRGETWNNRNQLGYLPADVTLDGTCDALDRGLTWNNRNRVGE